MSDTGCCGTDSKAGTKGDYEVVRIEKAKNNCNLCEDYAERQKSKPVAVMCCDGSCLRGEVARQAANILSHTLAPEKTVRICLGGAFTKDTGQRNLVRKATRLIALEGCLVECSSRMMKGVIEGLAPEVVIADRLYDFDRALFGVEEMPPGEILAHARTVAQKIACSL
ncbi:MAG: putative zinc-binding protein [Syntrophobacteraceae bacterium]